MLRLAVGLVATLLLLSVGFMFGWILGVKRGKQIRDNEAVTGTINFRPKDCE